MRTSNSFLERFKGKVSSIPKNGMNEVIKQAENPVEKEGWRSYLNSLTEKENQETQKQLEKEIKEINIIQRRILPKLSKIINSDECRILKSYEEISKKDEKG